MIRAIGRHAVTLLWLGMMSLTACTTLATATTLELEPVADGLLQPTAVTHAGDGTKRLFVVLQGGQIMIVEDEQVLAEPFLDIGGLISAGGERGLLDVAFHPDYAQNGLFFVNYTDTSGDTVVARYQVSDDPNQADPGSGQVVLTVEQPQGNHNGGQIRFGPDGYLYIALGDGGGGGDPFGNGQDLTTLLGALLRIDVDTGEPYGVPADNPFVNDPGARGEIWAYGLRNPWRFSFDRETGDLWIADVGQGDWEEINLQPAGSSGGENYGWNIVEGTHCFPPNTSCKTEGLVLPVLEYQNTDGHCSVTGGYRYRGESLEYLQGVFVFGDFCSGTVWGASEGSDGGWTFETLLKTGFRIATFGEDEAGEVYVADYEGGTVYRLVGAR
jgi:glucose/arabinose dehydrogenase